ncbi:MAG: hypothetical protein M3Q27_03550 [Actinomycetota bacterium]|nr:hypothetical protein [Actinomycetota bacterium]
MEHPTPSGTPVAVGVWRVAGLVLGLLAACSTGSTWASFSAATNNVADSYQAGTVVLADDEAASVPLLTLSGARGGDSSSGCVRVIYSGSLPSTVRLYGSSGGTGLAPYLDVEITRGVMTSGTFPSCSGFQADTASYGDPAPGVVFRGTLADFVATRSSWSSGLVDAPTATETWTNGETHAYRITVTLRADGAAEAKTATPVFTCEARNT